MHFSRPLSTFRLPRRLTAAVAALLLAVVATSASAAQSTDRDYPTRLTSPELHGRLDGGDDEYFFSFYAERGEVVVTFDVTAFGTNAGAHLDLFDRDGNSLAMMLAQGIDRGSERQVERLRFERRELVVMRLKGIRYGSEGGRGEYMVRLGGAVAFQPCE